MIKIAHISTDLSVGGAETILFKLITHFDPNEVQSTVISLSDMGEFGSRMKSEGIPVFTLNIDPNLPNPYKFLSFLKFLKVIQPDLIHTWLYHADFLGGMASLFIKKTALIWGIHHSRIGLKWDTPKTMLLAKLNSFLSALLPNQIVYCSQNALEEHQRIGYSKSHSLVIQNGIDTNEFIADQASRSAGRLKLGIPAEAPLIGLFGRFHPIKNHQMFIKAAGSLRRIRPDVKFIMCGEGIEWTNKILCDWIEKSGISSSVYLLGPWSDMPSLTSMIDIATSCSSSESFSLVLGEAMSCEVNCVTTDLPGPVSLLGDTGWIVPVGDSDSLARAWDTILGLSIAERKIKGKLARQRILENFSLDIMVKEYLNLYQSILYPSNVQ